MTDELSEATLDRRLRSVDPLEPGALPSEADTEAILRRLLAAGPDGARTRPALRRRLPARLRLAPLRLLVGATGGIAALAAGLAVLLGSTVTSPAFAVTRNPNGTITVHLMRVAGIAGANRTLASFGVRARIVSAVDLAAYVASVRPCQAKPVGMVRTITINPAAIPHRQVILLAADGNARLDYYGAVRARNAQASVKALEAARALAASARSSRKIGPVGTGMSFAGAPGTSATRTLRIYCASALTWPPGLVKQRVH
jgi:hypothetical protein